MSLLAAKVTFRKWWSLPLDLLPYLVEAIIVVFVVRAIYLLPVPDWAIIITGLTAGGGLYLGLNRLFHSRIQDDAIAYLRNRL